MMGTCNQNRGDTLNKEGLWSQTWVLLYTTYDCSLFVWMCAGTGNQKPMLRHMYLQELSYVCWVFML